MDALVPYLTQHDPAPARKVDVFFATAVEDGSRVHVDDIVLCELVWVLRAAYRLGKPTIAEALDKVMSTAIFSFNDRELLRAALTDYLKGPGDFSDYVIGRRNTTANGLRW